MKNYLVRHNDHRETTLGRLTINDRGLTLGRLRVSTAEPQTNNNKFNDENFSSDEEG